MALFERSQLYMSIQARQNTVSCSQEFSTAIQLSHQKLSPIRSSLWSNPKTRCSQSKKAQVRFQGRHTCTGLIPTCRFGLFFFFFSRADSGQNKAIWPPKQAGMGHWLPFFCFMWPCERGKKKREGRRR